MCLRDSFDLITGPSEFKYVLGNKAGSINNYIYRANAFIQVVSKETKWQMKAFVSKDVT
jgi:hypothetical protein